MYIDLKLFRLEHNEMFQSELARILGVTQSTLSRMERQYSDLNDLQYKKLVDEFGEDDVRSYVKENPLKNAILLPGKRRKLRPSDLQRVDTPSLENDTTNDTTQLIEVIRSQQEEIVRLNKRISDLLEKFFEK